MKTAMQKLNPIKCIVYLASTCTMSAIVYLIAYILGKGVPQIFLEIQYLFEGQPSLFDWSYNSNNMSLVPSVYNTVVMIFVSVGISSLLGILTAVYLVEYAKKENRLVRLIQLTSETLAGIPSIIYGLFGMIFFVSYVKLGYSLISGILTIAIMILPLIIRSTEEALKAVPQTYREASFGLGATKLRTVFVVILPSASNGIVSGIILAIGRVIGETAALIYTSGMNTDMASNIFQQGGRTLSVHMYMLSGEGLYIDKTYATAAVLLLVILGINGLSALFAKTVLRAK